MVRLMGDIVVFQPAGGTVELHDTAWAKALEIFAELARALKELQLAEKDFDAAHEKVIRLRDAYAQWRSRTQCMAEVLEVVHEERHVMWSGMPDGGDAIITAEKDDGSRAVVLWAERKVAKVVCRDFQLLERDENGEMQPVVLQKFTA